MLTAAQSCVLDYIRSYIAQHGIAPMRQEIQDAFGYASANAGDAHLRALVRRGAIKIHPGVTRGIEVLA